MEEELLFIKILMKLGLTICKRLFAIDGVEGVFFGSDFITITKNRIYDWQVMKPSVLGGIIDHFNSEDKTVEKSNHKESQKSLEKMKMILKLLSK